MLNKRRLFNDQWEFAKSSPTATAPGDMVFEPVDLPHDWLIYNSLDLYENSTGWYRRKLFISNPEQEEVLLCFDGVYMNSSLYVNQRFIGEWKYGYSSFEHEITAELVEGENEILVKVVHESPNSRWYSGAGIYRNVWLKTRNKTHLATDGIYVTTQKLENGWLVEVDTLAEIQEDVQLSNTLLYKGEIIADVEDKIPAGDEAPSHFVQQFSAGSPFLWSVEKPHLYQLKTELKRDDDSMEIIETVVQNIGFRQVTLDPNRGLQLNGKSMKLHGVCEHHDLGALGAAFNKMALRRRFIILKEMGVNAVRTAHNMPARELMDLADEMGLLVISEAFDMWERSKTQYDYARFFQDWATADVKSWVMRDRNHPSLLLWSIGNEIYDTHADERGQELTRMLMDEVYKHDPKQNAKVTIGSNYMPWENAQKCANIVKIAGYNYGEKYYHKHHAEHPDWIIYGSETASVVQSRGVYHFPYEKSILADDDEQCSALGNSSTSWGARSAEACIIADRDAPFSLGTFIWTGFDYIGEPTPYHTKNSYFGQIDTATFKKDSYFIYQAAWTDYKDKPMVHIFPYWDFNEGQIIDVRVCSNAPKVELQLNGRIIGVHEIDHEHGQELTGWWKIPYEKGELQAIAYDETGKVIAIDKRKSFTDPQKISLCPDKEKFTANGTDLIFVEINTKDKDGNLVANAVNRVEVKVTGEGRLIGLDNGDSTDYDQYKGISRKLFSGKLMAIIASTTKAGKVQVEVTSPGLESRTLKLETVKAGETETTGIAAVMKNKASVCEDGKEEGISLRKIEIVSEAGQRFDSSSREKIVRAKLYPENASYEEVDWSVVNDTGIASNISMIKGTGAEAVVTALGDGDFRVRCTSRNGTDKIKVISELEFQTDGLGTAYQDPYGFISGGLYDYSKGEITNGNERGVATSRDGETQVGFRGIDFGDYGSDTITIPIFALSSDPYSLQIWEGMPDEGGSRLADVVYQKDSRWNVYQEETYQLPKRLHGITSLCFVLNQKVHIKGFSFTKQNRAFEEIPACECDHIYGDAFEKKEDSVEGIGNNVSLELEKMDFTEEGTTKLVISGSSPIEKNTIHVRFTNEEGESNQIVEFQRSDGYEERVFHLEKITGMQKVMFIFLPGSNFDFRWFRFER